MIVLDTHIWVNWILGGEAALTPAIVSAMQQESRLTVSAISCFEVTMLVNRGRLELPLQVAMATALNMANTVTPNINTEKPKTKYLSFWGVLARA